LFLVTDKTEKNNNKKNKPIAEQKLSSAHGGAVKNKPRTEKEPRSANGRLANKV